MAATIPAVINANRVDSEKERALRNGLFSLIRPHSAVLEVGFGSAAAGKGANLDYYPSDINLTAMDIAFTDDDTGWERIVRAAYRKRKIDLSITRGSVENMSPQFEDGLFDVVTSSLLLCSVNNPAKALTEIARVLKRGGLYLSVEHILSESNINLRSQQKLLNPLQVVIADNCHLDRETDKLFKSVDTAFNVVDMKYVTLGSRYPISRQIYTVLGKITA